MDALKSALAAALKEGLTFPELEHLLYDAVLAHHQGNKTHAARALGVALRTMRAKIKQYGLTQYQGTIPYASRPRASKATQAKREANAQKAWERRHDRALYWGDE